MELGFIINLVFVSVLTVLFVTLSVNEGIQEKKKRERGVKRAEAEPKEIQYIKKVSCVAQA